MAKRTEKVTQAFHKTRWIKIKEGYEAYSKAVEDGLPIRILHPSGSFKVIRNGDNLPEGTELRFRAA